MNKSIVLNICGVKSLGGLEIAKNAIQAINESEFQLILLHNDNLSLTTYDPDQLIEIKTNLHRFFHPFLHLFLGRPKMNLINNSEATIHIGNFGFNTKNKSFIMLQNILPLEKKDLKNIMLRYFINKSFKQSDFIIYQLDHVAKSINNRFNKKLIRIGEINKSFKDLNTQVGIISILSKIENKNSAFIEEVLGQVSTTIPNIKITKFSSSNGTRDKGSKNFLQSLTGHNIYFHASFYETVGLPLYEASSNGLFVVGPNNNYMSYFDSNNSAKFTQNNVTSAVNQILMVLEKKQKNYESLSYVENWNLVLDII
jgi:hypothetical protein